jgi:hypothetical protein
MGNTESRNSIGVTASAFVNQLNETVQNVDGSALNSIAFNISNVEGDVNFQGNKINQKASVSVRALQNSVMCNSAVQGLSQKLMQAAESLTSGLPLGTNTEASNSISASVNMAMNLRNHVGQTCVARATNEFVFNAEKVGGSVNILGNTFDQEVNAIAECAQTTLASNSSMQKSSQDLSQTASAVTKGLDPADIMRSLALLIGVGALAFFLVGLTAMKTMGRAIKNFFKLLFVMLLALIFIALLLGGTVLIIKSKGFPEVFTYSNVDFEQLSGSTSPKEVKLGQTLFVCGQACKDSKDYTAFLWEPDPEPESEPGQVSGETKELKSKKGTCRLYEIKVPDDDAISKVRIEIEPVCPNPPPPLPSAAPSLEAKIDSKVEISKARRFSTEDPRNPYPEVEDEDEKGFYGIYLREPLSRAGEDEPAPASNPSKDGPACPGVKDGEGPMNINESALPPAVDETSKATREEEEETGFSTADQTQPASCGKITTAWNAYKECYGKIDKKLKDEERSAKECACLETLVTSTRTEGKSSACSFDARKVYYTANAAMGVVCPTNKEFDPSGAPCGMPGQKIVDLNVAKNWVGFKDVGILKFAGLSLKYSIASYILFALSFIFLVIIVVAARSLRDKSAAPTPAAKPAAVVPTAS